MFKGFIDRFLRFLFVGGFIAILVTGVVVSRKPFDDIKSYNAKKARILSRIEEKRAEIAALREKQRRFNSDREFVEALARQNRRVLPGELVFIFDD